MTKNDKTLEIQNIKALRDDKLLTRVGMNVPDTWTFEKCTDIYFDFESVESFCQFGKGDLLNHMKKHHPDKFQAFMDSMPSTHQAKKDLRWVCGAVPLSLRKDGLTFSHHKEVAKLDHKSQRKWLDIAFNEKIAVRELKRRINAAPKIEDKTTDTPAPKKEPAPEKAADKPDEIEKVKKEMSAVFGSEKENATKAREITSIVTSRIAEKGNMIDLLTDANETLKSESILLKKEIKDLKSDIDEKDKIIKILRGLKKNKAVKSDPDKHKKAWDIYQNLYIHFHKKDGWTLHMKDTTIPKQMKNLIDSDFTIDEIKMTADYMIKNDKHEKVLFIVNVLSPGSFKKSIARVINATKIGSGKIKKTDSKSYKNIGQNTVKKMAEKEKSKSEATKIETDSKDGTVKTSKGGFV